LYSDRLCEEDRGSQLGWRVVGCVLAEQDKGQLGRLGRSWASWVALEMKIGRKRKIGTGLAGNWPKRVWV
jgi:hypothetical protein